MKTLRKKLKRAFLALTAFASIMSAGTIYGKNVSMSLFYDGKNHAYTAEEVKIKINGKEITGLDVPPVIINERTMVPARAVFEEFGAEVAWNEATKEVYMTKGTDLVVLKIDSQIGHTNGVEFTMDTPAKIVNDRTMIPVRAASEALGASVGWDNSTRLVTINSSDYKDTTTGQNSTDNQKPETPAGENINVTEVSVPKSISDAQTFTVKASGEIGKYECFRLDEKRIIIDIYNAHNNISNSNITATNSSIVSSVRSSQNQTQPQYIVRVVLDVNAEVNYTASLSADKKSISLSFDSNTVTELSAKSSGAADYITIYGKTTPAVNVFTLSGPERLVVDIPNSQSLLKESYLERLNFIDEIKTGSPENGTTRVVMYLNKYVNYSVEKGVNNVTVSVTKSTLDNILYDADSGILILKNIDGLRESDFNLNNMYLNNKYEITLSGNYEHTYGYGTITSDDKYTSSIEVKTERNKTKIVLNQKSIFEVKSYDDSNEIRFKLVNPKEAYDKVIVLDAGHGKSDPGTSGNGLIEKELNLDIALRVYDLLEADGRVKVYLTRGDDSYPTNINRAKMGNEVADLFVSIHHNAAVGNTKAKGTEVLFAVHKTDVAGKLTSKSAAQFMQNYVINALGTVDRGIKERSDLIVLNQTTIPAILIEIAFLSNEEDAALIKQDENKDKAAMAIYSGITDMMNQYKLR